MDPREFVCMVKELYNSSNQIKSYVKEPQKFFLGHVIKAAKRDLRESGVVVDEAKAMELAKKETIRLFESMNAKYTEFAKKDDRQQIIFTSSRYSQLSPNINKQLGMTIKEIC